MPTRRRRFLAAVGAASASALAGCGSDGPVDSDPGGGADPDGPPDEKPIDPTDGPGPGSPATEFGDDAHAIDLAVADLTYALAPTTFRSADNAVRVDLAFGRTATAEYPATIRARIANVRPSDEERTLSLEGTPPFVSGVETAPDYVPDDAADRVPDPAGTLVPAPADDTLVEGAPPSVERGPEGFWRVAADGDWGLPGTVTLDAEESIDLSFALVGPAGSDGRPPGTYALGDGRVAIVAWPTGAPGIDPDSRFEGEFPPLPDAGSATWYHEVDRSTPAYVEPAVERASAPADLAFDLVNRSREALHGVGWRLYKLVDGAWHLVTVFRPVGDAAVPRPNLPPGRARPWRVRAFAGGVSPDDEWGEDVPYLGGGRYAFAVYERDATLAAAFDLEAPELSLEPTGDLSRERDGETVRLRSPAREEDDEPWVVTLEASEDADDPEEVIVEYLFREWLRGLRNLLAVALETDADRVVLETSPDVAHRALGAETGPDVTPVDPGRTVRFRGRTYDLEGRPLEADD